MSSEESEDEAVEGKGPKPRKIRKLAWERSKLKNIKAKLDEAYLEGLNEKQRRTSARISRSGEAISLAQLMALAGWFVTNRKKAY